MNYADPAARLSLLHPETGRGSTCPFGDTPLRTRRNIVRSLSLGIFDGLELLPWNLGSDPGAGKSWSIVQLSRRGGITASRPAVYPLKR
jgi:hypothetical protein